MSGTDWGKFRVESISWPTFLKRNLIHLELLALVARRVGKRVLEVGVGSGAQSAALSRRVDHVVTVDNDLRIIGAARPNLDRFGRRVSIVAADAFALPFRDLTFDVALSQGLMEHFGDAEVGALLREQLRVSRSVVFGVPSDRYPRQDVGDERLLPPAAWREVVEASIDPHAYDIDARYYRFDPESVKYSLLARRPLGRFSVVVTIDRR